MSRKNTGTIGWQSRCSVVAMTFAKRFVYVIRNEWARPRSYTGVTSQVASRVRAHNAGLCAATAAARPWMLDLVIAFPDEQPALAFERYLKSGSGVAFANRHLRAGAVTNR